MVRTVVSREEEFDPEQLELLAASVEFEDSLNELGIPLDEALSPLADPANPKGTHRYEVPTPSRDWSLDALEQAQKAYEGENYSRARKFSVVRVDRS